MIKHRPLLALITLCLITGCVITSDQSATSSSQKSTWIKIYADDQISMAGDILQNSDNSFMVVGGIGVSESNGIQGGVMLIKTDPNGDEQWMKVYGGKEYDAGSALLPVDGGGYLIAGETASFGAGGRDGYLIKVDRDGDEIWSHTYGSRLNESFTSISQSRDGGYLLVGNIEDPNDVIADPGEAGYGGLAGRSNIYVVKTDLDGNELWSHVFESDKNMITVGGLATKDGGSIVLSTIMYYPENDNDIFVMKIDSAGKKVWSRTWEGLSMSGYAMALTSDNCLVITGFIQVIKEIHPDLLIIKTDLEGNELWRATHGDANLYEFGQDVVENQEGQFMVLESSTDNLYAGKTTLRLVLYDSNGDFLKDNPILYPGDIKAQTILQHTDGNYLITGSLINPFADMYQAVLIKTNAEGVVQE